MSDHSARASVLDRMGSPKTTRVRRANRAVSSLIAGMMLLGISACGNDNPEADTEPTKGSTRSATPTTDPTPTVEPTPATDEEKAAAALLGYLDVRDDAYASGRISEKLNKYATGREHFALQEFVTQLTTSPETRFQGDWSHDVVDVKLQGDGAALVTECEDAANVNVVRLSDNKVLPWISFDDEEIPRRLRQTYRVAASDGAWKVESKTSLASKAREC